ncbi:hypothetical protein [Nocardia brasiliensis]|uniref:hypothetical protein n=1 Tax=Nocardia brasiliensis TaxID=37326 RepID=UPI002456EAA2|nr:hypothetical protein [Nocardia brasiliensis]
MQRPAGGRPPPAPPRAPAPPPPPATPRRGPAATARTECAATPVRTSSEVGVNAAARVAHASTVPSLKRS